MFRCSTVLYIVTILQAFTGDTLLIGSCGRPDLVGSIGHTAEEMARMMHHSLWKKLATLPDTVQVRPAATYVYSPHTSDGIG